MAEKQNIVIVGAGFGGLRVAVKIGAKLRVLKLLDKYRVTLIDRNNYHIFTPTLYEAATTSKETANYLQIKEVATISVADIIRNLPIKFIQSPVERIDLINGDIHCRSFSATEEKLKFDYLVLATGADINYFGIEGVEKFSLPLKTFMDALKIRDRVWELISSEQTILKIVIAGGGSTGVELAGELQEWLCQLREEVRQCETRVTLIESSPEILFGFHPTVRAKAFKRLKKLGVEILTQETIEATDDKKILLKSRREIPYDVLIWAGGIRAANLFSALPLKTEKRGRVEVIGQMECLPQSPDLKLYGKIYGIGDAICFYDPETNQPLPGVARAAIDQGTVVAHNIIEQIKMVEFKKYKPLIHQYVPKKYPYIIPIGGKYAIAKFGPFIISGLGGWFLKIAVELNYLLSILPNTMAIKTWLKSLKIFVQNDRLN